MNLKMKKKISNLTNSYFKPMKHQQERQIEAEHSCWKLAVNEFGSAKTYQVIQFIIDPRTKIDDSTLHKVICKSIGVPEEKCEHFQAKVGDKEMGESNWRKRQTIATLFQKSFKHYCNNPNRDDNGEKIPLLDPSKFVPTSLLRNELPHDVSVNENNNTEKESNNEEIDT